MPAGGFKYPRVLRMKISESSVVEVAGVKIGDDVWIGAGCIILDGVNSGDGAGGGRRRRRG